MPSLKKVVVDVQDVRSLVGQFLNERGDIEKLKQLSRSFEKDLFETQYPIMGADSEIIGTVTYLGQSITGASSSSA